MAHFASACQSGHMALWCDSADTMVATVSHKEVAVPIHCDYSKETVKETVELSNGPFSVSMALLARARRARARQSGHYYHVAPSPFHMEICVHYILCSYSSTEEVEALSGLIRPPRRKPKCDHTATRSHMNAT
jgi:hypothetical protein